LNGQLARIDGARSAADAKADAPADAATAAKAAAPQPDRDRRTFAHLTAISS
jgi:hypothetical protein